MQMKIALAAVGFYERDIEYNRNKIIKSEPYSLRSPESLTLSGLIL